jgi:hypothetical protein
VVLRLNGCSALYDSNAVGLKFSSSIELRKKNPPHDNPQAVDTNVQRQITRLIIPEQIEPLIPE